MRFFKKIDPLEMSVPKANKIILHLAYTKKKTNYSIWRNVLERRHAQNSVSPKTNKNPQLPLNRMNMP